MDSVLQPGERPGFLEALRNDDAISLAAHASLLGLDPISVLEERDPVRLTVIEAIVHRAEELDLKHRKSLASLIAGEVVSRIKV